jgi:hypothetical protein
VRGKTKLKLTSYHDAGVRGNVIAGLLNLDGDGTAGRVGPFDSCRLACSHLESALTFGDADGILLCQRQRGEERGSSSVQEAHLG